MTDYTTSDAYRRGEQAAADDLALVPPPSRFITVHGASGYWTMCKTCTHPPDRCTCTCEET